MRKYQTTRDGVEIKPENEIVALRRKNSKQFVWTEPGTGIVKRRIHISAARLHCTAPDGSQQDIEPGWLLGPGGWEAVGVPFECKVRRLGYEFVSEDGRKAEVFVRRIGTRLVVPGQLPAPSVDTRPGFSHHLRWADVRPGLDIILEAYANGVRLHKLLWDASAPTAFQSEVVMDDGLILDQNVRGFDNQRNTATRADVDQNRALVLDYQQTVMSLGNRTRLRTTSSWAGEAKAIDPVTHLATIVSVGVDDFPVRIVV